MEKKPLIEKAMLILSASKQLDSFELATIYGVLYFPFDSGKESDLKQSIGSFFFELLE